MSQQKQEESKGMLLFWGSGSIPCWRAMLAIHEVGLWNKCDKVQLEFSKKEHKGERVTNLNPRGQLPTFKDGDVTVNESSAICMYLDGKYGKNKLISGDDKTKALIFQRMFEMDNLRSAIVDPIIRYKFMIKKEEWDEKLLAEKSEPAKAELKKWDGFLADQNKNGCGYLAGKDFTLADVMFYPSLAFIKRQGVSLKQQYPALDKYYDLVAKRPSAIDTEPPHWKEGEGPLMLKGLM